MTYRIKICENKGKLHLVNGQSTSRMPFVTFVHLIDFLHTKASSRLNREIYSNQPVYEFNVDKETLHSLILDFDNSINIQYES